MKPSTRQWIGIGILAIVATAGCTLPQRTDGAEGTEPAVAETPAPEPLTTAATLRFEDLPVPSTFAFQPSQSFILENSDFRAGQLVYDGIATTEELSAYYREEMSRFDWRMVSSLERETVRLSFEKPTATAEVLIERAGGFSRKTRVTLNYVPRRSGSAGASAGSRPRAAWPSPRPAAGSAAAWTSTATPTAPTRTNSTTPASSAWPMNSRPGTPTPTAPRTSP